MEPPIRATAVETPNLATAVSKRCDVNGETLVAVASGGDGWSEDDTASSCPWGGSVDLGIGGIRSSCRPSVKPGRWWNPSDNGSEPVWLGIAGSQNWVG
jgi:hypothetical protein